MSSLQHIQHLAVREASRRREAEVLWLLFRDDPPELRLARVMATRRSARRGELSFRNLLAGCRGTCLVAAAWGQVMPGRVATVWPPRLARGEPETTGQRLLAEILERLRSQGVHVAHALLPSPGDGDSQRLNTLGFFHAAELAYLVSPHEQFPAERPAGPVEFVAYTAESRGCLAQLVEETYRQSLDIPALNGLRDIADVLDGYRYSGVFAPHRWLFVAHEGVNVGCLLLTDHPDHDQWELMYMGLIPRARSHGWGLQITRHAQWLARTAGRDRLVLAVDARNEPAIATYARAGFFEWDRRSVFLKPFVPPRF